MNSDRMDVAYVARLSRLYLTDEEKDLFEGQLAAVVEYIRKIGELDLTGVEPTSHVRAIENVFRDDDVKPGLDRDAALGNAPDSINDHFKVPKIVD